MKNLSLSICIPTYNRKNRLEQTLDVLVPALSKFQTLEIIVSDNCSVDGTDQIREKYADSLRWNTNSKNLGLLGNLKRLYEISNGKFIWFVGDDDYVSIEAVASVIKIIDENDIDHIFLNHEIVSSGSLTQRKSVVNSEKDLLMTEGSLELIDYLGQDYFCQLMFITANVYKKEKIEKAMGDVSSIVLPLYLTLYIMIYGKSYVVADSMIINDWSEISWSSHYEEIYTKDIPNVFYLIASECPSIKSRFNLLFRFRWIFKYKGLYLKFMLRALKLMRFSGEVK